MNPKKKITSNKKQATKVQGIYDMMRGYDKGAGEKQQSGKNGTMRVYKEEWFLQNPFKNTYTQA